MVDEFKIEKNVLIPKIASLQKYPFHKMEIGDSFEVDPQIEQKVRSAASNSKYGKFVVKKWEDKYRCWRVE